MSEGLGETLEQAKAILDAHNLKYEYKNYALYIQHPTKDWLAFDYRYTTGRWGTLLDRRNRYGKHYWCKGTKDLIDRFIMKLDDEDKND